MNIKLVDYKKDYKEECIRLMKETWDFDNLYKNSKDSNIIYNTFMEISIIESVYTKVVIDDKGNILGFLFAGKNEKVSLRKKIPLFIKYIYSILTGELGTRIQAFKKTLFILKEQEEVLIDKSSFDSIIHLFFVSKKSRGLGVGKYLLNDLFYKFKAEEVYDCILLTDETCNYGFYDYFGFKRHRTIESKINQNKNIKIFAYTYKL